MVVDVLLSDVCSGAFGCSGSVRVSCSKPRGSSVGMTTRHGLDGPGIEIADPSGRVV